MQKSNFMASMILMQGMVMENGIIASVIGEEEVQSECKTSYDLINKSIKAFFKKNDEPYGYAKYEDQLLAVAGRTVVSLDKKAQVVATCNAMLVELEKHAGQSVHHDSGKSWKKTKTDSNRFVYLKERTEAILKSLT